MSIKREDLDAGRIDLGSVTAGKRRSLIHPGDFLAEILAELDISEADFARKISVSPLRISHVVKGARPVTAELALLLGKALGQSPEYWLNLQAAHDLAKARKTTGRALSKIKAVA